ncbi:MAG: TlpA family protein disulfide reductase, partial [Bacteroidales bacterium]|nr:TlpA family protein disulfide reductase [Bacteroidales bacterium]
LERQIKWFDGDKENNVDKVCRQINQQLEEFKNENQDYSKAFIRYIEFDCKYLKLLSQLSIPPRNSSPKTYVDLSEEEIQKLNSCLNDSESTEAILSHNYRYLVSCYIDYLRVYDPDNKLNEGTQWMLNEVKVADYIPGALLREFIIGENLKNLCFNYHRNPELSDLINKYSGNRREAVLKEFNQWKDYTEQKFTEADFAEVEYPVLSGKDIDGNTVTLNDFKGQWVYIDIWATWCAPCKKEFPYLDQLKKNLKDYNIAFIGFSLDKEKDREKWKAMVKEMNLGGTQLHNPEWSSADSQFGITGVPHFAIINPDGKLMFNRAPRPSTGITERLLKAMAGKKR